MDNYKKVSVIMASYNHEKYIEKTIKSVLNQTYKNFEFIIIDDCSTDKSVEMIGKFQDERIRFYQATKNKGTVATFNNLLEKAQGEYVAIIGSDDIWNLDKLEKQIDYLEKNKDCAVCFSYVGFIDENDMEYFMEGECDTNLKIFNQENRSQGKWLQQLFRCGNCFCHPSSVIRKTIIEEIGYFDFRFRQLHDYYYWIKVLQKHPIYVFPEALTKYRRVRTENRSVSAATYDNTIRLFNESQEIVYEMIRDMSKEIFCQGFRDELMLRINCDEALVCEKFFVLLKWKIGGNNNIYPAVRYMDNYINTPEIRKCLEKNYGYTWRDYCDAKAKMYKIYPLELDAGYVALKKQNENNSNLLNIKNKELSQKNADNSRLEMEIVKMRNTFSWRITKPLRKMSQLRKKDEH